MMRTLPFRVSARVALAAFFPVCALGAWTARLAYTARQGTPLHLRVEGYDPRDLLSGRYMRYRVDYGLPDSALCTNDEGTRCLCFSNAPQTSAHPGPPPTVLSCEEPALQACSVFLRGECAGDRFLADIERYSIPEAWAPHLVTVPPDSSIAVRVDGQGFGVVTDFFVGGVPLAEWIAARPQ